MLMTTEPIYAYLMQVREVLNTGQFYTLLIIVPVHLRLWPTNNRSGSEVYRCNYRLSDTDRTAVI